MSDNIEQALCRLEAYRTSGRLIRGKWVDTKDGRELANLLAAFSTEAGTAQSTDACPADLLDPWLAHITPWFDEAGSDAAWPGMVARYGAVVRKLMSLSPERRHQLEYASRALMVREAMRHTKNSDVLAVCERIAVLCEAVAAGQPRDDAAFAAARAGAHVLAKAANAAGVAVVEAGAEPSWAAAPWLADKAAARAAGMMFVWEPEAASMAAWWAPKGAESKAAAVDRITTAIFDLIEAAS